MRDVESGMAGEVKRMWLPAQGAQYITDQLVKSRLASLGNRANATLSEQKTIRARTLTWKTEIQDD